MPYTKVNPNDIRLHLIESFAECEEFMRWADEQRGVVAYDLETNAKHWAGEGRPRLAQLGNLTQGWAMDWERYSGIYLEAMSLLDERRLPMVGHNSASFDTHFLARAGWRPRDWQANQHDGMTYCSLVDSAGLRALKSNCVLYIGEWCKLGQDDLKKAFHEHNWDWATVPTNFPAYWQYSAMDTVLTANLFAHHMELIERMGLYEAYQNERRVDEVMHHVEAHGMLLDIPYTEGKIAELTQVTSALELRARNEFGIENLKSGPQLAQAFQAAGVVLTKRTKTGWAMDKDTVEEITLTNDTPITNLVLEYRTAKKLLNTYFGPYLESVQPDGRIHPGYRRTQARTLRMSCGGPNMQNVPRPGEDVHGTRNAFIAPDGHVLISADWSNMEARIFCSLARDIPMQQAFIRGEDLHLSNARRMFNEPDMPKSDPRRQMGKSGLFLALFGGGAETLAISAKISQAQAEEVLQALHRGIPTIKQQIRERSNEMRANEAKYGRAFITVADGRRLSLQHEEDRYYKGGNYAIQGTARWVMAKALAAADNRGLTPYIIGVIHDEILLEVPEELTEWARAEIHDCMYDGENFAIPLEVGVGQPAKRWGLVDH